MVCRAKPMIMSRSDIYKRIKVEGGDRIAPRISSRRYPLGYTAPLYDDIILLGDGGPISKQVFALAYGFFCFRAKSEMS